MEFVVSPSRQNANKVRRYASLRWECWGCGMGIEKRQNHQDGFWVGEADHWGWDSVLDDERGEHVVEEDQVVMELQEDRGLSTESEIEQLEMVIQWRNF